VLVSVARSKTFGVYQYGVKILLDLNWSTPDPEATGAGLDGGSDLEAFLFAEKSVEQETLASAVWPCDSDYGDFGTDASQHVDGDGVQSTFAVIVNPNKVDRLIRKLRKVHLRLELLGHVHQ